MHAGARRTLDLGRLAPDLDASLSSAPPVTLSQIAELAGVRPSAVSNWRKRFPDFPHPTATATGGRDLFSLAAVEKWLVHHDRLVETKQSERLLFKATDILRSELDSRRIIEVLCTALAFVYVRDCGDELAGSVAFDSRMRDDASFAEIFAPLTTLKQATHEELLRVVGEVDRATIPTLFDSILARHTRFVETRTSDRLIELLVRLGLGAAPRASINRVFDPAAGQASLLLAAAQAAGADVELVGQELNDAAWRVAKQRFYVEERSAALARGDSLLDDAYPNLRADVVLCDPPYGAKVHFPVSSVAGGSVAGGRWEFGVPGTGIADYAWLQHVIHHLAADGRGYVLLPAGTLSRSGRDAEIRAEMLRQGAVEAVITLPPRAAEHTAVSLSLWIVRRPNEEGERAKVLLVDATSASAKPGEPLDEMLIERIAEAVEAWRTSAEVREQDRDFAVAVRVVKLLGPHANLRPARWVNRESALDVRQRRADFSKAVGEVGAASWRLMTTDIGTSKLRGDPTALVWIPVRDLIADGRAEIIRGVRLRPEDDRPDGARALRAHDLQLGGPRSAAYVDPEALAHSPRLTCPGDIVVAFVDDHLRTIVDRDGGCVLGLPVQALRLNEEWLDPAVAAAFLASPRNQRLLAATAPRRAQLDMRELQLPAIPASEAAELREVLSRIHASELLGHTILTASRDARDAVLDLSGYMADADGPATHDESSR
jgi:hypothetical protein